MSTSTSPSNGTHAGQNPTNDGLGDSKTQRLHDLQGSLRYAWRLLISIADGGSHLLDLPAGQLRCLRRIRENEGCKLIDLARETNLSLPNASRLVDRLVQRGLVTRETDPADRRAVRLYVTDEARGMIEQIDDKRLEHLRRMTSQLSPQQIDQAIAQLQVVIDAAEQARSAAVADELPANDYDELADLEND